MGSSRPHLIGLHGSHSYYGGATGGPGGKTRLKRRMSRRPASAHAIFETGSGGKLGLGAPTKVVACVRTSSCTHQFFSPPITSPSRPRHPTVHSIIEQFGVLFISHTGVLLYSFVRHTQRLGRKKCARLVDSRMRTKMKIIVLIGPFCQYSSCTESFAITLHFLSECILQFYLVFNYSTGKMLIQPCRLCGYRANPESQSTKSSTKTR